MEPQNQNPQSTAQPGVIPPQQSSAPNPPQPSVQQPAPPQQTLGSVDQANESDKEFLPALLFAWFLGNFGADRFYLGKTGSAIAKLLTFGGFGLWTLYDVVMLVFGKTRDKQGRPLKEYARYRKGAIIAFVILMVIQVLSILLAIFVILATFQQVQEQAQDIERQNNAASTQSNTAKDAERQMEINILHGQLESHYAEDGAYPNLEELNDSTYRSQNLGGLDRETLQDPAGFSAQLAKNPRLGTYAYTVLPAGCSGVPSGSNPCSEYTLTATLEDGSTYEKRSLN